MKRDENVAKLVDSLYSGKVFGTYWKDPLPKNKERLLELFKATDRTPRSLFEALINEHKDSNQKKIAGEKTPSHLYHIPELLEWFPQAKIIHIIRDPRAVLSSEINKDAKPDYPIKKRGFLYNTGLFIYVWLQWMSAFRLDEKYHIKYKDRFLTVRYEDLLNCHKTTVQKICSLLEFNFEEDVLNPPKVDSSFTPNSEKNINYSNGYYKLLSILLKTKMYKMGYLN